MKQLLCEAIKSVIKISSLKPDINLRFFNEFYRIGETLSDNSSFIELTSKEKKNKSDSIYLFSCVYHIKYAL